MYNLVTRSKTALFALVATVGFLFSSSALAVKPSERFTIKDLAIAVNAGEVDPALTGEFSTLIAALVETGLDVPLDGNGRFTVFAPTDQAFLDTLGLDANGITMLINSGPEARALVSNILLYHVARGERFSGDVLDSDRIRMLNRDFTFPTASGPMGTPAVEDNNGEFAELELSLIDLGTDNGVVHVIKRVLIP
ncbi:MAG: fasciclin domain-containing protein [Xanthomonadales bacterium]|nr:fasciclin domain-containing protein [Xanthomonadales bacterium]